MPARKKKGRLRPISQLFVFCFPSLFAFDSSMGLVLSSRPFVLDQGVDDEARQHGGVDADPSRRLKAVVHGAVKLQGAEEEKEKGRQIAQRPMGNFLSQAPPHEDPEKGDEDHGGDGGEKNHRRPLAVHGQCHGHELGLVPQLADEKGRGHGEYGPSGAGLYLLFLILIIRF